jgi:hypothetical protein
MKTMKTEKCTPQKCNATTDKKIYVGAKLYPVRTAVICGLCADRYYNDYPVYRIK